MVENINYERRLKNIFEQLKDLRIKIDQKDETICEIDHYIYNVEKPIKELENGGLKNNYIKRDIMRLFDRLLDLRERKNLHLEDLEDLLKKKNKFMRKRTSNTSRC